jgi:hypothetical protein
MLERLPSVPAESIVLEFQQQRAGEYLTLVNRRAGGFTAGSKTAQDPAMLRLSRLQIWDQGIETPLLVEALC